MKLHDEIIDAKNTLAESQGQQIADEHEDSAKAYDPTDLDMASGRTSYKQEKKELLNHINQGKKVAKTERDLQIASLNGETDEDELVKIENKYKKAKIKTLE